MFRKSLITSVFIVAALFAANVGVSAQIFTARGKVEMRQADGTSVPVENAVIDVYRTDISSKGISAKTNKKGEYSIVGLTFGGVFMFAASAPGAAPDIIPDIKGSIEKDFNFTLNAGDGKRLTMEEALEMRKSGNFTTSGSEAKLTPEQKKAQEEQQKKIDEAKAVNSRIENANKVIDAAVKDGDAAFKAKDYATAITKYTEGYDADREFLGSAPILLNKRGVAYKLRGMDHYNNFVKSKDAAEEAAAKADLQASYESGKASLNLVTTAPTPKEAEIANSLPKNKIDSNLVMREALRLLTQTKLDTTKLDVLYTLYQDAITAEPLPEKKLALRLEVANLFQGVGSCEKAVDEFGKVLVEKPDDPDALAGKGLCLINMGYESNKDEQLQEGLNILQHYIEVAPPTHKYVESAKQMIEGIKQDKQLAPQKTPKAAPRKKP